MNDWALFGRGTKTRIWMGSGSWATQFPWIANPISDFDIILESLDPI
jgi:hypothetical protein